MKISKMNRLTLFFLLPFVALLADSQWRSERPSDEITFRLVTDFLPKHIAPDRAMSTRLQVRKVLSHPLKEKTGNLPAAFQADKEFLLQSATLEKINPPAISEESFEYRWIIRDPGKDALYLVAPKPIILLDRNRIFSIYVRGADHNHNLTAVFSAPGQPKQELFICSLDFKGWKRFEVVIPPFLHRRNPSKNRRYELYFHGLKLQTYFREQPGTITFNLGPLIIMADVSENKIPGAQMKDF